MATRKPRAAAAALEIPLYFRDGSLRVLSAERICERDRPEFLMIMSALGIAPMSYESAQKLMGSDEDSDDAAHYKSKRRKPKQEATLGDILARALNSSDGTGSGGVEDTTAIVVDIANAATSKPVKVEKPSAYYPVYRFHREAINLSYSHMEILNCNFVKDLIANGTYLIHTHDRYIRATTLEEISDVETLTRLSQKIFDCNRSFDMKRYDYLRTLVFTSVVVDGVHCNKRPLELPAGWRIIPASEIGDKHADDVLYVNVGGRTLYFAGLRSRSQARAMITDIVLNHNIRSEEFAAIWAGETLKSIADELASAVWRRKDYLQKMQIEVISESRLKKMHDMLKTGGSAWVTSMVEQLMNAGFASSRFVAAGIIMTTGDMYINIGDHETERETRYIGKYEVILGMSKSVAIRNIASPRKGVNHPVFDDDNCLGGFGEILTRCFRTDDYLTLGLSILAMIQHFNPSYLENFKEWPSEIPAETYVCKIHTLYGESVEDYSGDEEEDEG